VAVRAGVASLIVLAACATATVRHRYEARFSETRASREQWARYVATRYGCDTVLVRLPPFTDLYAPAISRVRLGMQVCDVVGMSRPASIQVDTTPDGIREEWRFRLSASGAARRAITWLVLEGSYPVDLRVTYVGAT
jgi:hypothetical protein